MNDVGLSMWLDVSRLLARCCSRRSEWTTTTMTVLLILLVMMVMLMLVMEMTMLLDVPRAYSSRCRAS